ncbi:MAG: methyl-accepting chemotaxis protein [Oscillospiraceae bacterium]|jgi:methyl-accepting chemotaxis protein|nr:methyl-accepting chemotaxis protein [Oscillospiraceae bacterium]
MTISKKIILLVLIPLALIATAIGIFSYSMHLKSSLELSAGRTMNICITYSIMLDGDAVQRDIAADTPGESWQYWQDASDKVLVDNGLLYFYVMDINQNDGQIAYYISADDSTGAYEFMQPEDVSIFADEMYETGVTGVPSTTGIYDSGEWGMCVSGFAPVKNSAGEVVAVIGADFAADDVMKEIRIFGFIIIGLSIGFAVIVGVISTIIAKKIFVKPIKRIVTLTDRLATGDTSFKFEKSRGKDEISALNRSVISMALNSIAKGEYLAKVASGDLSVDFTVKSESDALGNAIIHLVEQQRALIAEINKGSSSVAKYSELMAHSAGELASGAFHQNEEIENLKSDINELTERMRQTSLESNIAADLQNESLDITNHGAQRIDNLVVSVREIVDVNREIAKITKLIDDIADQTNILALNAAVEAARVGTAGRGFAVVAEEVRSLATKSSGAAKQIDTLIAKASAKSELGLSSSLETSEFFAKISEKTNAASTEIRDIAAKNEELSAEIKLINDRLDRILDIVRSNSSGAQESSALSQEMTGTASVLKQHTDLFIL